MLACSFLISQVIGTIIAKKLYFFYFSWPGGGGGELGTPSGSVHVGYCT